MRRKVKNIIKAKRISNKHRKVFKGSLGLPVTTYAHGVIKALKGKGRRLLARGGRGGAGGEGDLVFRHGGGGGGGVEVTRRVCTHIFSLGRTEFYTGRRGGREEGVLAELI